MYISIPDCLCIYILLGLCTWIFFHLCFFTQKNIDILISGEKNNSTEWLDMPEELRKLSVILVSIFISFFVLSISLILWPILLPVFVFLKEFKLFSKISF